MSDEIRRLTAELAADPGSLVFLRLGEMLRQAGRLEAAAKVAIQGLSRYPDLPGAHDLYARVLVDHQDFESAFDEWDMTLRLDPNHGGAHKGIAFLFWKAGDLQSALRHLNAAADDLPGDGQIAAALTRVRARLAELEKPAPPPAPAPPPEPAAGPSTPAEAPRDDILRDEGLLLVDAAGLRLLGTLSSVGDGIADQVAADLAGVSREAARAARLLELGEWRTIAVESPTANYFLAPPTDETLLLIVRSATLPMGRIALGTGRAVEAARRWLETAG